MKNYAIFLWRCFRMSFVGDWRYHLWMLALTVIALLGLNAYCKQLVHGLIATGMTDQVTWGAYIGNFTFLVGMAAAAVMLVIPDYIYDKKEARDLHQMQSGEEADARYPPQQTQVRLPALQAGADAEEPRAMTDEPTTQPATARPAWLRRSMLGIRPS